MNVVFDGFSQPKKVKSALFGWQEPLASQIKNMNPQ